MQLSCISNSRLLGHRTGFGFAAGAAVLLLTCCAGLPALAQEDDTFEALARESGPKTVLDKDYGRKYEQYRPGVSPDNTVFDARRASWKFENYPRPAKQKYPVIIDGVKNGTWCGGSVLGTMSLKAGWKNMYNEGRTGSGNSCAFVFGKKRAPGFTLDGLRAHNVWDGIRPQANAPNWTIRNCWLSYVRDDAVENDNMNSGTIDDCFFDGVFVGISCRNTGDTDHSKNLVTMQNSLMRLQPLPGPGPKHWYKPGNGHMGFTKWNRFAPRLSLKNNIFMLEQLPWSGKRGLPFPKLHESENNVIVWLGKGEYPGQIQKGFRVVTDRSIWDKARAAWIKAHPLVARPEGGWRTTYVNNKHTYKQLPISEIPWDKYTHVIHFQVYPAFKDGKPGLDTTTFRFENRASFVRAAHAHGVKALFSLISTRDAKIDAAMLANTSPKHIDAFVALLAAYVKEKDYDGIDVDWEGSPNAAQFGALITRLRAALPDKTITTAVSISKRHAVGAVADKIDQINLMGYEGDTTRYNNIAADRTWYHCAVRKGAGQKFGGRGNLKSQEETLWYYLNKTRRGLPRIPASKIGLGIPFFCRGQKGRRRLEGRNGVTGPGQLFAEKKTAQDTRIRMNFNELVKSVYWSKGLKRRDPETRNSYISYDVPGYENDAFVAFTDPKRVGEYIALKKELGLGGVMTFSLGQEYIAGAKGDARYPLSTAVFEAVTSRRQ